MVEKVVEEGEGRTVAELRDPRTQYPQALVDVTKHAVDKARKRWPLRFGHLGAAQVADELLYIYRNATQVEQRRDGKWRYRLYNTWVVATLGYDQHTVVLLTCYPTRRVKRTTDYDAQVSA